MHSIKVKEPKKEPKKETEKMNNKQYKTETFKAGQTYRSYLSKTLKVKTPKLNQARRNLQKNFSVSKNVFLKKY